MLCSKNVSPKPKIWDPTSKIQDWRPQIEDPRHKMLDLGFQILHSIWNLISQFHNFSFTWWAPPASQTFKISIVKIHDSNYISYLTRRKKNLHEWNYIIIISSILWINWKSIWTFKFNIQLFYHTIIIQLQILSMSSLYDSS